MSTDVELAGAIARLGPVADLTVLHCVSAYPTPLGGVRLGRIAELAATTGRPVGFSDHTLGLSAAVAAVALGAVAIEKHVTWVAPADVAGARRGPITPRPCPCRRPTHGSASSATSCGR